MKPTFQENGVEIYQGDCREVLRSLPDESVHCVVTSPPYWGLRDYGCEGQIGLEDSPVKYIATMREVFAEVRRVLRSDGTLWLNMGDSYCGPNGRSSGGQYDSTTLDFGAGTIAARNCPTNRAWPGLKAKDLVGVPWALATALRDPHYAGRIKSELDRVWLAAMIDAEGCMFIHKRKEGQHNGQGYFRQNASYGSGLEVANCSEAVVLRCQQITGIGSICTQGPEQNGRRKQKIYRWNVRTNECRWILEEVYPYLVAKQQQARLAIACPSSGEKAEAAHAALIGLHNGISSEVDFPAPQSLYQPGWWLRQDIIWSKANPMPESVTDRCTKAHEYIFLLSKSERYYYNQEAILEPWTCDRDDMREKGVRTGTAYLQQGGNGFSNSEKPVKVPPNYKGSVPGRNGGDGQERRSDTDRAARDGRNKRSVWEVTTQPFPEAHFATFPEDLIKPCILAGCPEGGTVLDPFGGSGTTAKVARELHCKAILVELNPEYIQIAARRLSQHVFNFAENRAGGVAPA